MINVKRKLGHQFQLDLKKEWSELELYRKINMRGQVGFRPIQSSTPNFAPRVRFRSHVFVKHALIVLSAAFAILINQYISYLVDKL